MRLLRQVGQEKLNREGPPMRARAIVLPGGVTGRDAPERGAPRLRGTWTRKCQGSQMLNRPPLFHLYATLECRKENAGALPQSAVAGEKQKKNNFLLLRIYYTKCEYRCQYDFWFFWERKILNIRCEKGAGSLENTGFGRKWGQKMQCSAGKGGRRREECLMMIL